MSDKFRCKVNNNINNLQVFSYFFHEKTFRKPLFITYAIRISPLRSPHYIKNSYTYQFLKKVIFVPHRNIALRLSPLEWGYFFNILPFTGAK